MPRKEDPRPILLVELLPNVEWKMNWKGGKNKDLAKDTKEAKALVQNP